MAVFKVKGLRRRWVLNTLVIVIMLGLVCVFAITAAFAAYYYSAMKSDMRHRVQTSTDFFGDYQNLSYSDYYQSCVTYASTFTDHTDIELQFVDTNGDLIASSYGQWSVEVLDTTDISGAISSRGIASFVGKNPKTGDESGAKKREK